MGRSVSHCQRARAAVSLDLDGGVSELEGAFLHAHLARCEACGAYSDDVVALTSLLRAQPLEPLGHGVKLTFTHRTSRWRSLSVGTSAAALVLVGLVSATQFAARPAALSSLDRSSSSVAASTEELRQIYQELQLVDRRDTPNFAPNPRVR
jgi:predicted anti-sigma-YlaC factor YlaD